MLIPPLRKLSGIAGILIFSLCFPAVPGISQSELFSVASLAESVGRDNPFVRFQEPVYLSYEELQKLSQNPTPDAGLKEKLDKLWTTPIISNEAHYVGVKPRHLHDPRLGSFVRIASWNIEKSFNIKEAIDFFLSKNSFSDMIDKDIVEPEGAVWQDMQRQRERIIDADILLFQEMEIGIKRSGYLNAAAEMAKALGMNYAYAAQYLEVDPVTLGMEELEFEADDKVVEAEAREFFSVDPAQYKGAFGSAVLSHYPIKRVEIHPLKTQPYDWYWGEMQKVGITEKLRRVGTKSLFKNVIQRELKVGGRHFFRVDLEVPELPEKTLTIINIHLEIKCEPQYRELQMREILALVRDIRNPVVLMGDFNMAPTDISSTTAGRILKRTAKNPTAWFSLAVNVLSPHALVINTTRLLSNFTKNLNDPTAKHISIIAPNPLESFFKMMEEYRFNDSHAFDFRGDPNRSVGQKDKKLANANQRGKKGFVTSFRVLRPIGLVGKFRLDWVFMKSYAYAPYDTGEPYRFALISGRRWKT
jgi:endonuclease/exonuclease/phosphatase family metal-dependent hydrolase